MYCLGNYYLVKWDEQEDSVSVVPKCSCSGGSNESDTYTVFTLAFSIPFRSVPF